MKTVYCTCNVSVLEALITLIDKLNIQSYQVIEQVTAKGYKGDNRLNNPVWPGYNSAVIMQIPDDEKAQELMSVIRKFNKNAFNDNELVTACAWTMDDFCFD